MNTNLLVPTLRQIQRTEVYIRTKNETNDEAIDFTIGTGSPKTFLEKRSTETLK